MVPDSQKWYSGRWMLFIIVRKDKLSTTAHMCCHTEQLCYK